MVSHSGPGGAVQQVAAAAPSQAAVLWPVAEIALVGVLFFAVLTVKRGWRGAALIRRAGERIKAWVLAAPATAALWVFLALHSLTLGELTSEVRTEVLRTHSTNLTQLAEHPVSALLGSALWIEIPDLPMVALLAFCVLAPVERWLGTFRTMCVFFFGHVMATLITAGVLTALLRVESERYEARGFGSVIDVGISYGSLCVAGLLTYRVRRLPLRILVMAALAAGVVASGTFFEDYTAFGHNTALVLGFLLRPVAAPAMARSAARAAAPPPGADGPDGEGDAGGPRKEELSGSA
ncbi:rhomboid-like protein [Streptomyces sp. NPDC001404]|uniref:rhomboid-like protein n=1 Tax=Streptomyces sp. NPDC001404 TaxID=3364571 RepID=UPI003677EA61